MKMGEKEKEKTMETLGKNRRRGNSLVLICVHLTKLSNNKKSETQIFSYHF